MPNIITQLTLSEVSVVDRPANPGARVVLLKRHGEEDEDLSKLMEIVSKVAENQEVDFGEILNTYLKDRVTEEMMEMVWPVVYAFRESVTATLSELEGSEREEKLRDNVEQFLSAMRMVVNSTVGKSDKPAGTSGSPHKKGTTMTLEELLKALEEAGVKVTEKKDSLPSITLPETAIDVDGINKALADTPVTVELVENELVAKQEEAPEFIEIDGEKVAKSDVPAPLLKQLEKQQKDIEALKKKDEQVELLKRANDLIPSLPGSDEVRCLIVKAVSDIKDDKAREEAEQTLKAAEAAIKATTTEKGHGAGDDDAGDKAELDKLIKTYREDNPSASYEQAYVAVTKDGRGRELKKSIHQD